MRGDAGVGARIEVVKAQTADLELLAPLFDAYRQFYGAQSATYAARQFLSTRLLRGESDIMLAIPASSDGPVHRSAVGFAQLYRSFSSIALDPIVILNDLFVAEEWRERGVARSLVDAVVAFGVASGAAYVELATQKTNRRALGLYESVGFQCDTEFTHMSLSLRSTAESEAGPINDASRRVQ